MIIFAIPLMAKEASKNWGGVTRNFNATIYSIFNQTSSEFRCIVCCNDIPELDEPYDDRLEFIRAEIPVPHQWIEMSRDKFWKLTLIAVRIREVLESMPQPEKGIYVMPVDADDLLNCHIAEWCAKNPYENGAVSSDGYVWNGESRHLTIYPRIDTYCGSCNIIKMYRQDLPEIMPYSSDLCHDGTTAGVLNAKYPIRYDHNTVVDRYAAQGKPFSRLPFRSTIYKLGTGENISALYAKEHPQMNAGRNFHPIAFLRKLNPLRYRIITKKVRREFWIV